jgi:glycine cleavage system aminomethyltransferase T
MLTEEAGIIDDTIVTHCSDYIGMVVNSGNKFNDIVHMNQVKRQNNMEVDIIHRTDLSLIAIQGPGS